MGCAGSSPMIATAGSDMLKSAKHVAADAAKGAENAVEGVAESVGKTIENAKETVGNAVTEIAHDLGNVINEKTNELDTAKNELLERLHLGGGGGGGGQPVESNAVQDSETSTTNHLETTALEALARAPTPPLDLDTVLKTVTTNGGSDEIKHAIAANSTAATDNSAASVGLEKLAAEVKQSAQVNAVGELEAGAESLTATTTTVQENIAAATHVLTDTAATAASNGKAAANESVVDLIALLAEEKRPGTTEWEKHADQLTKVRKMNVFKGGGGGGGKFRRSRAIEPQIQPIHPANYILPVGTTEPTASNHMKEALLLPDDNDSCYSDIYYNSNSSSPRSTTTNQRRKRRRLARLPTNSVLAMNAKHMQRELAALLSNQRSAVGALRSLNASPAPGRRFDYNPQRVRYASAAAPTPTPSILKPLTSRAIVNPPTVVPQSAAELPPLPRTTNWKIYSGGSSKLDVLSPPTTELPLTAVSARFVDAPTAYSVIPQSKIKSTKAFAPLREPKTISHARVLGHTRTGSAASRRLFTPRLVSPLKDTRIPAATTTTTGSAERSRALIQEKIDRRANKVKQQTAQPPTSIIKLEREASIRESRASTPPDKADSMTTNGFTLSKALSPIKMAAESHSLPHLNSAKPKRNVTSPLMLEIVEEAMERTKNGEPFMESSEVVVRTMESGKVKAESGLRERQESTKQESTKAGIKSHSRTVRTHNEGKPGNESGLLTRTADWNNAQESREVHTANASASTSRSKAETMSPMRRSASRVETNAESAAMTEHGPLKIDLTQNGNEGGFTTNPNIKNGVANQRNSLSQKSWKGNSSESHDIRYTNIMNRFETPPAAKGVKREGKIYSSETNNLKNKVQFQKGENTTTTSSEADESNFTATSEYDSNVSAEVIEDNELNSKMRPYQIYEENLKQRYDSWHNESNMLRGYQLVDHDFYIIGSPDRIKTGDRAPDRIKTSDRGPGRIKTTDRRTDRIKISDRVSRSQSAATGYSQVNYANIKDNAINQQRKKECSRCNTLQQLNYISSAITNSQNSTPTKSSKSSTSLVIHTMQTTSEPEEEESTNEEATVSEREYEEEEQYETNNEEEQYQTNNEEEQYETNDVESNLTQNTSTEEETNTQIDMEQSSELPTIFSSSNEQNEEESYETTDESTNTISPPIKSNIVEHTYSEQKTTTDPTAFSSSNEFEETQQTHVTPTQKATCATTTTTTQPTPHKDIHIYIASSIEDLLNMLPADTAYLKLGQRSATMMTLRSTTSPPILHSHSQRSTPRKSKRHSACEHYHLEIAKAPDFLNEMSAGSTNLLSPFALEGSSKTHSHPPTPRCAVCYNKYVIK